MKEVVNKIIKTREETRRALSSAGLRIVESKTNFLFVDLGRPCRKYWELLKRRNLNSVLGERR
ncbi:MAG: hypothetical protein ACP5KB_03710 [Thermoprotei archaeon]